MSEGPAYVLLLFRILDLFLSNEVAPGVIAVSSLVTLYRPRKKDNDEKLPREHTPLCLPGCTSQASHPITAGPETFPGRARHPLQHVSSPDEPHLHSHKCPGTAQDKPLLCRYELLRKGKFILIRLTEACSATPRSCSYLVHCKYRGLIWGLKQAAHKTTLYRGSAFHDQRFHICNHPYTCAYLQFDSGHVLAFTDQSHMMDITAGDKAEARFERCTASAAGAPMWQHGHMCSCMHDRALLQASPAHPPIT